MSREARPGVWALEEVFDPETFFAELRERHFVVELETRAPRE